MTVCFHRKKNGARMNRSEISNFCKQAIALK
jgi:hypothetical protein